MIRIFIGWDKQEAVSYHVLCHSILKRASLPVQITPLNRANMRFFERPRGAHDSTDFSISRFLVPFLCGYRGWALFMDCDMLCLGDVADFAPYASAFNGYGETARVVKHDYTPADAQKFLGREQAPYTNKNWSSVMLFNNDMCQALTLDYVNTAPGLAMHQFNWCKPHQVGALPKEWNYLVGEANQCEPEDAKLIHFTRGTPCFPEYADCEFADKWRSEQDDMVRYG